MKFQSCNPINQLLKSNSIKSSYSINPSLKKGLDWVPPIRSWIRLS